MTTHLSYWQIILLSVPVILANITLPVQGLIDVAIIGHLDSPNYLGAVGLAGQLFALLLVSFNFLQYASSGLSAQALGLGDYAKLQRVLLRALLLAFTIGAVLVLFQQLWWQLALWFFSPPPDITTLFHEYYAVRIWAAPIELANYAFIGWFAGQSKPSLLLIQQLLISVSNVIFNLIFVLHFQWDVYGVALGTVLAQCIGFISGIVMAQQLFKKNKLSFFTINWQRLRNQAELIKLLGLNRDIWIRTLLLTLSVSWLMRLSTQQGSDILAANLILLQLATLASFALDGIAVTTESQVGQAYSTHNKHQLSDIVKKTTTVAVITSLVISLLFIVFKPVYIYIMTDIENITLIVEHYYYLVAVIPFIAVMAYQIDGIMFGLTANSAIRNSMIIVAVIFFPVSYILAGAFDNIGIWLSMYVLFILRAGILGRYYWNFLKTL